MPKGGKRGKGQPNSSQSEPDDDVNTSRNSSIHSTRGSRGNMSDKWNSSGSSINSSRYRDRQDDEMDSSQESSQLDDSQEDLDSPDNASGFSSSYGPDRSRGSPYQQSSKMLGDLRDEYYSESISGLHISPLPSRLSPVGDPHRPISSPGGNSLFGESVLDSSYSTPKQRRPLHNSPKLQSSQYTRLQTSYRSDDSYDDVEGNANIFEQMFGSSFRKTCGICVVVLFLLFIVFFALPTKTVVEDNIISSDLPSREVIVSRFESKFKNLMALFPSQTTRMWKILKSATKRMLKVNEPVMPAVLLIVANKGAFDTVDCLTIKFAQVAAEAYSIKSPVVISKSDTSAYRNPNRLKEYLDEQLHNILQHNKVAVLENIESISGQAAMILHSYCDNEFAPFKDAIIILTLYIDSEKELVSDSEIENYLESQWENDIDKDKRAALIYSRLGNNIVVVNKEDGVSNICV